MIKITHYKNPHEFTFRWVDRTEMFDPKLDRIECDVKNAAQQRRSVKSLKQGDQIGFFWSECHKWIRAMVHAYDEDRHIVYIWAIDYGFPFVVKSENVFRLPEYFSKTRLWPRIFLGGISFCVPSDIHYNIDKRIAERKTQKYWSSGAIDEMRKLIEGAAFLEFTDVQTTKMKGNERLFGRLMIGNKLGQKINIIKCLHEMNMAETSLSRYDMGLKTLSDFVGVKQDQNDPFHAKVGTSVTDIESVAFEYASSSSEDRSLTEELDDSQNEFFDESVSVMFNPREPNRPIRAYAPANQPTKNRTFVMNDSNRVPPDVLKQRIADRQKKSSETSSKKSGLKNQEKPASASKDESPTRALSDSSAVPGTRNFQRYTNGNGRHDDVYQRNHAPARMQYNNNNNNNRFERRYNENVPNRHSGSGRKPDRQRGRPSENHSRKPPASANNNVATNDEIKKEETANEGKLENEGQTVKQE